MHADSEMEPALRKKFKTSLVWKKEKRGCSHGTKPFTFEFFQKSFFEENRNFQILSAKKFKFRQFSFKHSLKRLHTRNLESVRRQNFDKMRHGKGKMVSDENETCTVRKPFLESSFLIFAACTLIRGLYYVLSICQHLLFFGDIERMCED